MEMERNSVDRKTKIILPATIHEEYKDGMWIAEVAMVDKEEFSKVPKELVLCKDCIRRGNPRVCIVAKFAEQTGTPYFVIDNRGEWFCADGKRIET